MTRRSLVAVALTSPILAAPQDKKAAEPKPAARNITTEELEKMVQEDYFFLDVREPKELEELGTLKKYVNIPLDQLEARLAEIPKGKTIVPL